MAPEPDLPKIGFKLLVFDGVVIEFLKLTHPKNIKKLIKIF